jgi:AAA+ ATPase superfamily predicted ATPase
VPRISAPAFAGRHEEMAALRQALAAPPALVLVEGAARIGKSRLIRQFLDRANGLGTHPLVAGCPPFRRPRT